MYVAPINSIMIYLCIVDCLLLHDNECLLLHDNEVSPWCRFVTTNFVSLSDSRTRTDTGRCAGCRRVENGS